MFLTSLDPRAAIKGSRDPLGLVPLWSHFGRHVVGNLTTVSGSVRGYTTTLLGYHFAREAQDRQGTNPESTLALFLKFEQLAAYCRYHNDKDGDFRGIDRVKKNLADSATVKISARQADQILSNQKVYGLWGLFSGPARASALLERGEAVLTPAARDFIEQQYLAALTKQGLKDGREIADLLRQPVADVHLDGKHATLAKAIARLHGRTLTAKERDFYTEHLALGGPNDSTNGLQRQLAQLMRQLPMEPTFERKQLRDLVKRAGHEGWEPLAGRLQRIDHLESVLVPAGEAFGFMVARHGQTAAAVAQELTNKWRQLEGIDTNAIDTLKEEIGEAFHDPTAGQRWAKLAGALKAGDFGEALRVLIEHNASVMKARNGSQPWVRLTKGRLDVRFRDEGGQLTNRKELPDSWVNNYFLNPLKAVVVTLAKT